MCLNSRTTGDIDLAASTQPATQHATMTNHSDLPGYLRLGVNIDHVATIRNARGGRHPDPVAAAHLAVAAGADGITAHLREDRRHIGAGDIARLKAELTKPLNLEMATPPEMLAIALKAGPNACCLVPERREERTTEGGLDVLSNRSAALAREGLRLTEGAARAASCGLEVHAGHGLTYDTVAAVAVLPQMKELNIGHFIIGEAISVGLKEAVRRMRAAMDEARGSALATAARRRAD